MKRWLVKFEYGRTRIVSARTEVIARMKAKNLLNAKILSCTEIA